MAPFWSRRPAAPPPPPEPARYSTKATVHALTAAAKLVDVAGQDPGTQAAVKAEGWQKSAWDFYDSVGELWYAANFFGGCLSRVRLTVATKDEEGAIGPAFGDAIMGPDPDPAAEPGAEVEIGREVNHPLAEEGMAAVSRLRSPIGGQPTILRAFGVNLAVAGDCYLLGTEEQTAGEAKRRKWEVLSTEELKQEGTGQSAKLLRDGKEVPKPYTLVRIWRPHPRRSSKPDSAVRPLLDILEELVLLTRGVRATTTSRLAGAGILLVPHEIDYPGSEQDASDSEAADPLTTDLIAAMTTPIADKASAAAVVPFILRGKAEHLEKIRHLDFTRTFDSYPSVALRGEAIQRFAQGIDLPVEIVTGQGGANHWSAWQVDESTFKSHIEPLLELICDGLTRGYLYPWLEANGHAPEAIDGLIVHYDASELVTHPDQGSDAKEAYDRWELKGSTLRRVYGFSEDDRPDDEELAARAERAPAMGQAQGGGQSTGANPRDGSGDVEAGTPSTEGEATTPAVTLATTELLAWGANVALARAVDRAGARIKSKANGNHAVRSTIGQAANDQVGVLLGPHAVGEILGGPIGPLFDGEFDALARTTRTQLAEWGVDGADRIARALATHVEERAKDRLFDVRVRVRVTDVAELVAAGV